MDIEFDPKKNASNLVEHGIRLARASEFSPVAIVEDTRKNYGRTRYRAFGFIGTKAHALAFTVAEDRKSGSKRVRAIRAFSSEVGPGSRKENASKQEARAPFGFNRNGKGSSLRPATEQEIKNYDISKKTRR